MNMDEIVLVALFLVGLAFLVWVLCIPGLIAKNKNHPHASVIGILGVVGGLLFFVGWIIALIWACVLPKESDEMVRKIKASPDIADELSKLKKLENDGILTSDEFQFKKSQLLAMPS